MPLFLVDNDASLLSLITTAPDVALFVPVSNVVVPTPTAFTNPVTVPLSPGPTSLIVFVVIVLSVFLVSVSYTHLTLPTKA